MSDWYPGGLVTLRLTRRQWERVIRALEKGDTKADRAIQDRLVAQLKGPKAW